MKVGEFWHSGIWPKHIKNFPMGNSRNSFKYFFNFSTLRSNFSKKCPEVISRFVVLSTKSTTLNQNMRW